MTFHQQLGPAVHAHLASLAKLGGWVVPYLLNDESLDEARVAGDWPVTKGCDPPHCRRDCEMATFGKRYVVQQPEVEHGED